MLTLQADERRHETATVLGVPEVQTLGLSDDVFLRLVLIPPGKFQMGAPDREEDAFEGAKPQHEVAVTRPFYIGRHHVTRGQFAAFVGAAKFQTDAEKAGWAWEIDKSFPAHGRVLARLMKNGSSWRNPGFAQTDEHPVVCVSHNDAVAFCDWLSRKTGKAVSLPTEAQWEFACRAGTKDRLLWGNFNGCDQSWQGRFLLQPAFRWKDEFVFTSPGGQFKPNAHGLLDMLGNAWQWCGDWYEKDYYSNAPKADPPGPVRGTERVLRGGSWGDRTGADCASRWHAPPSTAWDDSGFRVVCTVEAAKPAGPRPTSRSASRPNP